MEFKMEQQLLMHLFETLTGEYFLDHLPKVQVSDNPRNLTVDLPDKHLYTYLKDGHGAVV